MKSITPLLRTLMAAVAMGLAGSAAQALTVTFGGQADSGPLAGMQLSGELSYADPGIGFDGSVALDSFAVEFNGNTYTLAGADLPALAWFSMGNFVGIDYTDTDSFSTAFTMTAGFIDVQEAFFTYQVNGSDQGLGGFDKFIPVEPVPEPGSAALLLAGLGLLGAARRRQAAA